MSLFNVEEKTTFVGNQTLRRRNSTKRRATFSDIKAGIEYNFEGNTMEKVIGLDDRTLNPVVLMYY